MSYIHRDLESVISEVTKEYPVVLVTGPRHVGKTTMLQRMMAGTSRGYVSLDDLTERALAKSDPELFLQLHQPPVLIDEARFYGVYPAPCGPAGEIASDTIRTSCSW